jgi:hypothetical protein
LAAEQDGSCEEQEIDGDSPNVTEPEGFRNSAVSAHGQWNKLCPDFVHDHTLEISVPESAKTQSQETEPHNCDEEMPVTRAFKFFLNIRLTLILFLGLCWLHRNV